MQWNSLACLFSFRLTPTLFFDWCTILRSVKRSRQVHYTDRKHIPIPICHSINFLGVFPTFSPIKKQRKEEKKKNLQILSTNFLFIFFRQKDRNDSPLFKLLENLKFESRFIELFIFFFPKKPPSGRTGSCLQNLFFFFFYRLAKSPVKRKVTSIDSVFHALWALPETDKNNFQRSPFSKPLNQMRFSYSSWSTILNLALGLKSPCRPFFSFVCTK